MKDRTKYSGRIIKALSGFYYVKRNGDGVVYACRAKGIFRKKGFAPLVGDLCEFIITHEGDKEGNIEAISPRTSVLERPTVANVDLGLVVFALKDPEPNTILLDRMLVGLEQEGISIVICFNKMDLADDAGLSIAKRYEALGYPVVYACALHGDGRGELFGHLKGHLSAMSGPSGAGKSSIFNLLSGHSLMEVGTISEKIRRGKQTTRHVELCELDEDTYLVDTPGFSSLRLSDLPKEELYKCFPEFIEPAGECRFSSCSHLFEPDDACEIKRRLSSGEIFPERYESYKQFYGELCEDMGY